MNDKPTEQTISDLPVITKFIYSIGVLPTSYKMSMTYEEQVVWLCNYLETTVIPAVNQNGEAVEELQNLYELLRAYVNDYFDNLDVQQEINNKLNQMAEDGSLTELIKRYIDPIQESFETRIENQIDTINTKVDASVGIQPIPVDSTEDMTDTSKVYVNTTDGYWYYYDGDNWTQGGIYQSTSDSDYIEELRNEMYDINGNMVLDDLFEIGNISFSNQGWTYSSSTTRIRTIEGQTISLKTGDELIITNENVDFYIGYQMPNEAYETLGAWNNGGFKVKCTGNYALLFRFHGEQEDISSVYEILQYVKIKKHNITQIDEINKIINNGTYIKQYIINDLDLGGFNSNGYNMYAWGKFNNSRFSHKDSILSSKPIVIEMGDGYEIAGQRWSGAAHTQANYFDETGWLKQLIINPNEYCSFQIRKSDNSAFTDDNMNFSDYMNIYYLDYTFKPNYNLSNIKSINHRGYNTVAPENTIPAFQLSKVNGFNIIETDVRLTSDNVPVLLHDATIDRTSNGEGRIASMTYEQVSQYDFGSWKSEEYAGTKIPTLEELISLARDIGLHCYLELESDVAFTQEIINGIIDMIDSYSMLNKVTFTSYNVAHLLLVKNKNRSIRLGLVRTNSDTYLKAIDKLQSLKTEKNEIMYSDDFTNYTDNIRDRLKYCNIPYEVWVPWRNDQIIGMDPYVTGFYTNLLNAGEVIYWNSISSE